MTRVLKQIINTAIITLIFAIAGILIKNWSPGLIDWNGSVFLLLSFFFIMASAFLVSGIGEKKPADIQSVFTLAVIGLKFILVAIVALIYFNVLKKTGLNNVVLFFILYLAYTTYLIISLVKMQKNRSLKQE